MRLSVMRINFVRFLETTTRAASMFSKATCLMVPILKTLGTNSLSSKTI